MAIVYPNEAYPTDAAVEALDGTVDAGTGLVYVAKGVGPNSTPSYEVQYNRRLQRMNAALSTLRQGMVVDEGSLMVGVYPIAYSLGGVAKMFEGATAQAVPDNATRKVYLDSANALQIAAAFPSDETTYLPLATVVVASGVATITDERVGVMYGVSRVGTSAKNVLFTPTVVLAGVLSVKVWEIEWVAPADFTLVNATGRVATAPAGSALIVDIRVGGVSIFSSNADRINVLAGSQSDTSATVDHAVVAGDVLTFDVTQVGSSTSGSDMTIVLKGLAALQV